MGLFSRLFDGHAARGERPVVSAEFCAGFADAAHAYAMQPAVEAAAIAGVKAAAHRERVSVPKEYRAQDTDDSLTRRIRAVCMDVCCAKIRRGDVGRSWRGDYVPEATRECRAAVKPIIAGIPVIGMIAAWLLSRFITWLLGKIIWWFLEEALERLYPGASREAPGTVVAGFAMREGIQ